jgi:hypothetical protein
LRKNRAQFSIRIADADGQWPRIQPGESSLAEKPEGGRRLSQLRRYRRSILRLRADGYTLSQVCKWLRMNDVSVTIAGLPIFLIREDRKEAKQSRR